LWLNLGELVHAALHRPFCRGGLPRRQPQASFLKEYPLAGMFFGIGLYLVMNLIVLPLSAYHLMTPLGRREMIQGLLIHMTIIGLPISYSVRRFSS
jgi:hypothetical protein